MFMLIVSSGCNKPPKHKYIKICPTGSQRSPIKVTTNSSATDEAKLVTMSNASANVYTIVANATYAHPIGTCILVKQIGAGVTSITGATGVTLEGGGQSVSAGSCAISNRYDMATCIKVATDTWSIQGAVGAIA